MSWKITSLKEITVNLDNKRKPLNESERNLISKHQLYPYIGANNIMGYVDEYLFDREILCVAEDGGSWGKNEKCATYVSEKCWVNNHAHVLGFNGKADLKFIMYYLNQADLNKFITGTTRGKLTKSALDSIEIPLPPLPIQKRIAEILDAADALKRKDQELLKKYDELAQAIFFDMFGDPVKNEKGWEVKTIEQLVTNSRHSIKRGPFGGALKKEIFVNSGYLVYEQFHALNNDFTFERYYIDEKKYQELVAFDVKPKDIIISCSGVYLGKLAIVPEGAKPGIINQALLKLTLDENIYKNEFFVKVFTQENFKEKYFASERGAAIPNFPPMSAFKEFGFICPPIALQNEYLITTQNLNKQYKIGLSGQIKTGNLFETLVEKGFKGELAV